MPQTHFFTSKDHLEDPVSISRFLGAPLLSTQQDEANIERSCPPPKQVMKSRAEKRYSANSALSPKPNHAYTTNPVPPRPASPRLALLMAHLRVEAFGEERGAPLLHVHH